MKERTRARRESRAGRGNRLGRQVDAARCEKRSEEIGETRLFHEGERTTEGVRLRRRRRRKVEQPPERVSRSNNAPTSALAASQNTPVLFFLLLSRRLSFSQRRALCRRLYVHTTDNSACTRAYRIHKLRTMTFFQKIPVSCSVLFQNDVITIKH